MPFLPFAAQAPPRFVPWQRRPGPGSSRPQRGDSGAGAAASPPRGRTPLGCGSAQPGPQRAALAAMSSGASVSALQRLVEQLKLEAGVERIKVSVCPAGPRRQPRRRRSGAQETAARRKWRLPGPSRAWVRGGSRPDPRASAGDPTGASGDAAGPRDQVRGLRGRVHSRLATRWRPGRCQPGCGRMLLRDGEGGERDGCWRRMLGLPQLPPLRWGIGRES